MQLFNLWLLFLAYPNWIGQEQQLRNCAILQPLVALLGLAKLDRPRTATTQLCNCSTVGCCSWRIHIAQAKNSNCATVETVQPLVAVLGLSQLNRPRTATAQLWKLFNLWLLFLAYPNWIGQEQQLFNYSTLQPCCCTWPSQIG